MELCKDQLPYNSIVVLRCGFKDPKIAEKVDRVVCTRVETLESDHEEADS